MRRRGLVTAARRDFFRRRHLASAGPSGPSRQPIIPDDANTIAHLYVSDGVIIDTKNNVWTENGALTRTAYAPLIGFPNGKSAEGLTGWSASNYLSLPAPTLNFAGNWLVVAIFGGAGGTGVFVSNIPAAQDQGYAVTVSGGKTYSGDIRFTIGLLGMGSSLTPAGAVSSVGSVGFNNTSKLSLRKSNATATQTDVLNFTPVAGGQPTVIGKNTINNSPLEATAILCEVAFFAVAPTVAYINAIHLAAYGA